MQPQRPLALRRTCLRTRCGTASPPICSSRTPTFGSSKCCSKQLHTAREHWTEGKVHYAFHPRCGETVSIKRRLTRHGVDLVVIEQPDGSLAQLPAWMLQEAATRLGLRTKPRFPLEALRCLRAEVDALLDFLPSDSITEEDGHDTIHGKSPTEPARAARGGAARRAAVGAAGTACDAGGGTVARDRRGARNRGGRP